MRRRKGAWGWLFVGLTAVGSVQSSPARESEERPPEVRMDEVEIKGEVERPGVFYIIPRREVELDLGRQTKDFRDEILQPLYPPAFEHWLRQRSSTPKR